MVNNATFNNISVTSISWRPVYWWMVMSEVSLGIVNRRTAVQSRRASQHIYHNGEHYDVIKIPIMGKLNISLHSEALAIE